MRTILLLSDFSSVADNAANYALKLARALKANVMLFYARSVRRHYDLVLAGDAGDDDEEHVQREVLIRLEALKKRLNQSMEQEGGYQPLVSSFLHQHAIKDCLPDVIREYNIDLVVTGAHQSNMVSNFLFGDYVMGIIDHAPCPVLIVPEYTGFKGVKNISYSTDIRYCDIPAMKILTRFAASLRAAISLLHICAPGLPEMLDQEAALLFTDTISQRVNYPLITYKSIKASDAEATLNGLIAHGKLDILAIEHKKYHFFRRLFKGGLTEKVSTYMRIPLMIVPVQYNC